MKQNIKSMKQKSKKKYREKSMKPKVDFLIRPIKLPRLLQKKKRTQITNIRNEKGDITTNIKMVIGEHSEQFMSINLTNQIRWANSLKAQTTKAHSEKTKNLTSSKETEFVIKKFSHKEKSRPRELQLGILTNI